MSTASNDALWVRARAAAEAALAMLPEVERAALPEGLRIRVSGVPMEILAGDRVLATLPSVTFTGPMPPAVVDVEPESTPGPAKPRRRRRGRRGGARDADPS